ncbi:2'-5' RNA ligase family protein [Kribbella solani]|uniref:2'-5' RNA ligase n=1 Tax=Kribbella solani TaxID=236067 RepID=A0A841DMQ7_9ACTN|nr:2'-5' RNA ligase family protein [Kribbella solani]MBB5979822.1 2'-5' RNA ligase [Kribbella solani]
MTDVTELRDHWYWRPGWRAGRSFYTWHITFADSPAVVDLGQQYAAALADLPEYDPIPLRWLHLTMQGIGFTDETERRTIDQIVEAARGRLAAIPPVDITIGPAQIDTEALKLPVQPVEALTGIRDAIRTAIADVRGEDNVTESPDYRPHVSIGYTNTTGPARRAVESLARHTPRTTQMTVEAVALIDLNRDHKMYQWTTVAEAQLGGHR